MYRDETAERISNEIVWKLSAAWGPAVDGAALERPIEVAVRLAMLDGPHGGLTDFDPQENLAVRVRYAVDAVLAAFSVTPEWRRRVGPDVEEAVRAALSGKKRPASASAEAGRVELTYFL